MLENQHTLEFNQKQRNMMSYSELEPAPRKETYGVEGAEPSEDIRSPKMADAESRVTWLRRRLGELIPNEELDSAVMIMQRELVEAGAQRGAYDALMQVARTVQDMTVQQHVHVEKHPSQEQLLGEVYGLTLRQLEIMGNSIGETCGWGLYVPPELSIATVLKPEEVDNVMDRHIFNRHVGQGRHAVVAKPPVLGLRGGKYIVLVQGELSLWEVDDELV